MRLKLGFLHRWVVFLLIPLLLWTALFSGTPFVALSQSSTDLELLESDNQLVQRQGHWLTQNAPSSSGGSYLYSSGTSDDELILQFTGKTIEVLYLTGPNMGVLVLEVDSVVLRTVITTSDETAFGQRAVINYLTDEKHTLRVYGSQGVLGVDAFYSQYNRESVELLHDIRFPCPLPALTQRISVNNSGGDSGLSTTEVDPSISLDGRYIAFSSSAPLISGDSNFLSDIFLYDRVLCEITRVSVVTGGAQANGNSQFPSISGDGRYVAFSSFATNLAVGDTNTCWIFTTPGTCPDIFVHDRQNNITTRVSVATDGTQINHLPLAPAISGNGRYVTFYSEATNLVPNDTNNRIDVFLRDTQNNTTVRVSVNNSGNQVTNHSLLPSISYDGCYIAFQSSDGNMISGDNNGAADIFIHDCETNTVTRISSGVGGVQTNGSSQYASISADGLHVGFESTATNLVTGDTNGSSDIFLFSIPTNTTSRVSVGLGNTQPNGHSYRPSVSQDGRYIGFESLATNLISGDSNGFRDVFLYDAQTNATRRGSVTTSGGQTNNDSFDPSVTRDGIVLAFESPATNIVSNDVNNSPDAFIAITCNLGLICNNHDGGLNGASPQVASVFFINGICNNPIQHRDAIAEISGIVGTNRSVMGIYSQSAVSDGDCFSLGGLQDIGEAIQMLINLALDGLLPSVITPTNPAVVALAQEIRNHFEIHNQISPTSRLEIIGHSQGGLVIARALQHLSQHWSAWNAYRERIDVTTLGGTSFTFPEGPTYRHFVHLGSGRFNLTSPDDPFPWLVGVDSSSSNIPLFQKRYYYRYQADNLSQCPSDQPPHINHSLCAYLVSYQRDLGTIDTLALFNPDTRFSSLFETLSDNPSPSDYITFNTGAPATGYWVMGDWNGDGQKTLGIYGVNGVFYYTNVANASPAPNQWLAIWFGLIGRPAVAGIFDVASQNDCIGIVDSANFPPWGTAFAMYYTCDMAGGNPPKRLQWLSVLLSDGAGFGGLGSHQFTAGDFNGDGIDTIAVRRGPYIAYTQIPPTTIAALFPDAQYIGVPNSNDYGYFLAGDWDRNRIDTFGLFYQNGYFYRWNILGWVSGASILQRVGQPVGTPAFATSWDHQE